MMTTKSKVTTYKEKHPFDKMYKELRQADKLECLVRGERKTIKLLSTHKVIYSYLLNIFNLYNSTGRTTILSNERISAETGISESTVKRVKGELKQCEVIVCNERKRGSGGFMPTRFYDVVNLLESKSHKLIRGVRLKTLYNKIADRKVILSELLFYGEGDVKAGWTAKQGCNYWKNRSYEVMTGVYLEGDLTSKILYKLDDFFTIQDELKDYEINNLTEDSSK